MYLAISLVALIVACGLPLVAATPLLRVCADPNNLPYSNNRLQGFENKLAALIAKDLNADVTYSWYPQRGKFFSHTLAAATCDVVMGAPAGLQDVAVTRPYYRSTYAFVSRHDRNLHIHSFDDPQLRTLRIGVHVLGESDDSLPPVNALVSRGLARNLVGFSIFGNLTETNPSADLIAAVAAKQVDLAVAWGPLAGYFSKTSTVPLDVTPIDRDASHPELPLSFDIGIGVRQGDEQLRQRLDAELTYRKPEINELLRSYGIE
jgi:quinoprotein dehydrogenase-associated probable ABC transporter substrate-binding protein